MLHRNHQHFSFLSLPICDERVDEKGVDNCLKEASFLLGPKKYCEKARIEQGSSRQAHTQKMSCHSLKVRIDDRTELSRSIVVCVITVDFYTAFLRVNLQFIFCPIKRGQNGI